MFNLLTLYADEENIYAECRVINKSKKGYYIIAAYCSFFLIFGGIWINLVGPRELSTILPLFILIIIIVLVFPIKYLLWNLFGVEKLIISTKAISYYYDYGFIRTGIKIKKFNILSVNFDVINDTESDKIGYLRFIDNDEKYNMPVILHEVSVLMKSDQIELLISSIKYLFEIEKIQNTSYLGFSLN